MSVINISDSDLKTQLKNSPFMIIKYYADWCGACRLIAPKFTKLANDERFQNITFAEVNAEKNPEARKLAGVTNLPFFAIFKNGELVEADFTAKIEGVTSLIEKCQN